MKKKINGIAGFTLIEIIVVIAIIAVLTAIIAPIGFSSIEKSKVAKLSKDCRSIEVAAYNMYANTGYFPGSNWADDSPGDPLAGAAVGEGFITAPTVLNLTTWDGPYLESWLKNPWGGSYFWDFNLADQNGDGIGYEHVVWVDNLGPVDGYSNANKRIPLAQRQVFDRQFDNDNLTSGFVQVWSGDNTTGNVGFISLQGAH